MMRTISFRPTLREVTSNYDSSMYAYVWKFDKHRMIEVLTSSAPFEPVAVYRVSKVYFP